MLILSTISRPEVTIMQPRPQSTVHIHPSRRRQRQNLSNTLFSDPFIQQLMIKLHTIVIMLLNVISKAVNKRRIKSISRILSINQILLSKSRQDWQRIDFRVPLTKLLKAKATMPKNLGCNTACSSNFYTHINHFKRRPMLMLD